MFSPWGNVTLFVLAIGMVSLWARDAHRRQRRGEKGWTAGHKIGVAGMLLIVLSQVFVLI